jgi:hypothetical protein
MSKNLLLFILIFGFLISNIVSAENSGVKGAECSRIEINETLLDSVALKGIAENLGFLVAGKLFYKESSGYCVPTNETYLVSVLDGGYPKIVSALNGHTPKAEMVKLAGEDFLLIFYFAGGNQYVLRLYKFCDGLLKEVNTPIFASNIRSIELVDDIVLVKNQVHSDGGEAVIESESYRYQDNQFVLVK